MANLCFGSFKFGFMLIWRGHTFIFFLQFSFSSWKTLTKSLRSTGFIRVRMVCELLLPSGCRPAVFPHSEGRSVTAGLELSGLDRVRANTGVRPNQASLQNYWFFRTVPGQQNPPTHPTVNTIDVDVSAMQITSGLMHCFYYGCFWPLSPLSRFLVARQPAVGASNIS